MNASWTVPGSHSVRVYGSEQSCHHVIAEFFASGNHRHDPLVMISRPGTFEGASQQLQSIRHSSSDAGGRILFFDAGAALSQIMEGGCPDPVRASRFFKHVLAQARSGQQDGTIRLYGEMVDILCQQGQHAAALQLEDLAGGVFAIDPRVSILCGYSIARFRGNAADLDSVCRKHKFVIPAGDIADRLGDLAGHERASADGFESLVNPSPERAVYLIDDDASVRRSLSRLLALSDWQVRAFDSAEAFLAELDHLPWGGIILDMQLLGMSGLELLRQMANAGLHWPVIAMSGSHDQGAEDEALHLGARLYLHKPFEAEALLDAIAHAFRPGGNTGPHGQSI